MLKESFVNVLLMLGKVICYSKKSLCDGKAQLTAWGIFEIWLLSHFTCWEVPLIEQARA
jgi:hypothetical protein